MADNTTGGTSSTTSTNTGSSFDNVVQGMYGNINQQQSDMYAYLQQLAQRMGTAGAMQQAAQAVQPYAQAAADEAGSLAMTAAQLDEQQRQYNESLAQRQAEFDQQQENYNTQLMMSMFQNTGWTPELLEALGYGDLSGSDMNALAQQLNQLGFTNPSGVGSSQNQYGGTLGQYNNWGGQTGLIYA